ncbi:MAG: hypothetical protein IJU95_03395 [Treponema sp.]|nr:hypothetical protein [Treponema sp.]
MDSVFQTLEAHSGITVASAHREYMEKLILERTAGMGISCVEYNSLIKRDDGELSYLTNAAAVNETYFFREEKQFEFLRSEIFLPHKGNRLNIWSASCSSGEEALSIYTLAKDCGISPSIWASDIDTDALESFKSGIYSRNSFRSDGSKYHPLIEKEGNWEGDRITISQDVISKIQIFPYNLASKSPPPVQESSMDVIFMRNVFIYFTQEVRLAILNKMAKFLKDDGIIILSINEVGNIDRKGIPFDKIHSGTVYYLKKSSGKEKAKKSYLSPQSNVLPKATALPYTSLLAQATALPKATALPQAASLNQAAQAPRKKEQPIKTRHTETAATASPPTAASSSSIEELFFRIRDCIARHDCTGARKLMQEKNFKPHEMEFKFFFLALIYMEEKNEEQALGQLEKAVLLNGDFWPARYGLSFLQKKMGKETECRKSFEACKLSIIRYRQNSRKDYDFMIGQFSPEYFEMLCNNYLKDTAEGQA